MGFFYSGEAANSYILLAVGGKEVKDPQVMLDLIAELKPGASVPFKLRRNQSLLEPQVRIGKRPPMRRDPDQ